MTWSRLYVEIDVLAIELAVQTWVIDGKDSVLVSQSKDEEASLLG